MDAVDFAMEIGNKYNSSIMLLHVLDSYKYPYLLSTVILAPTFGSDKFEKERKKFEELMSSLREKYVQTSAGVVASGTDNTNPDDDMGTSSSAENTRRSFETEIVEAETSTSSTIVDYAESKNVDLIVIGSRGRTGLKKMLVGSTASDVVKYAHCPVFIVR